MMSNYDRGSSGAFAKSSLHSRSARAILQQSAVSRQGGEHCHCAFDALREVASRRSASKRASEKEQHTRRHAHRHIYTPRPAVKGRHAHSAAAMLFETARKCVRNKLRSVQLLYYVQHLGPVRGVVLAAHARPVWAPYQNTCHPHSARPQRMQSARVAVELARSTVLNIERAVTRTSRPAAAGAPSQMH